MGSLAHELTGDNCRYFAVLSASQLNCSDWSRAGDVGADWRRDRKSTLDLKNWLDPPSEWS